MSPRSERALLRVQTSVRGIADAIRDAEVRHGARWLFYCAVVGVVAGLGALLFDFLSNAGVHVFLERFAGWTPARPGGEKPMFPGVPGEPNLLLLALVPAVGGLLSGLLVAWLAPEASGHGTDAAIDAYHRKGGLIRPRVPLVKILASAITLGSGGSGGREGPIAQTGAGFGSWIATRLRLSENDRCILLAAGMGAGIGSIFRAPLAGALFAAEILYSTAEFEASVLIPACVASIIAYSTFTIVHGTGTLFTCPTLAFTNPAELLAYSALAVVLVVYGFLYVRIFYGTHGLFERWKFPSFLKPAVGGLVTGVLAILFLRAAKSPETLSVLSLGYGVVQHAIDRPALLSAGLLAAIALGKILTTSASIGSGGSAGVFGPSMVIGGAAGGAVGIVLHAWFPGVVREPAAFVIVGMAGFFSGIAKTPISSLVMVSEITGSYSLLIPSMWVCVLTFAMSRRWHLYSKQVPSKVDSPAHQGRFALEVLAGVPVGEGIEPGRTVHVLGAGDSVRSALEAASRSGQATFPVVDVSQGLVGVITIEDLRRAAKEESGAGFRARDVMRSGVPHVAPTTDLAQALRILANVDVEEIPVWDEERRTLAGMLSHKQVVRVYVERMAALEKASLPARA